MGARVTAAVPAPPGYSDDFLIKADKNSQHAWRDAAGTGRPECADCRTASSPTRSADASTRCGSSGTTWRRSFGDAELEALSRTVALLIFSGTNENPTAAAAHWVLPTAAYLEKDGTFVNCHGRVQRIGRAFPPLAGSREDWTLLLDIAQRLDHPLAWRTPQEIFLAMAKTVAAFEGLTYEAIGSQGVPLGRGAARRGPASERPSEWPRTNDAGPAHQADAGRASSSSVS